MGWLDWILGRAAEQPAEDPTERPGSPPPSNRAAVAPYDVDDLRSRDIYSLSAAELDALVAADRADDARRQRHSGVIQRSEYLSPEDEARYVTAGDDGKPNLRLVRKRGQLVLTVPEGMVSFRSRALPKLGIYAFRARGVSFHDEAVTTAGLSAGAKVRLVREPDNPHDPNAVALHAGDAAEPFGYVNTQNAARISRVLDVGGLLAAITLNGSTKGAAGDPVTVLVATPELLAHLRRT